MHSELVFGQITYSGNVSINNIYKLIFRHMRI